MATFMNPERRRSPRERIEKLTYIHLEPENGAILLNVSETGLGFHAAGPIHAEGPIYFYISVEGRWQIKVLSEVAWTDLSRKTGGLQFLSCEEGAAEFTAWLRQLLKRPVRVAPRPVTAEPAAAEPAAAKPAAAQEVPRAAVQFTSQVTPLATPPTVSEGAAATQATYEPAREATPQTTRQVTCEATPPAAGQGAREISRSIPRVAVFPKPAREQPSVVLRAARESNLPPSGLELWRVVWEAHNLGAVARWMATLCVAAAVLILFHVPLGNSLVRLGEGLRAGARQHNPPLVKSAMGSAIPQTSPVAGPAVAPAAAAPTATFTATPATAAAESKSPAEVFAELNQEMQALEQAYPAEEVGTAAAPSPKPDTSINHLVNGRRRGTQAAGLSAKPASAPNRPLYANAPARPTSELDTGASVSARDLVPPELKEPAAMPARGVEARPGGEPAQVQQEDAAMAQAGISSTGRAVVQAPAEAVGSGVGTYFDVGSFRDVKWANTVAGQLGQLGFRAIIVRKHLLWMTSYHVVVGPYRNDDQLDAVRAKLEPLGFKTYSARIQ